MEHITATLLFVVLFSSLTSLVIGYDLCIVSSILEQINQDYLLCPATNSNCFKKSFFVSMLPPGAIIGSLIAGIFSDLFGRRKGLMLGSFFIAFGSLWFVSNPSYTRLLMGRFIIGVGIGIGFVVFSIYIPEISPAKYRGGLVASQDCALSFGCLVSYVIFAIFSPKKWRSLLIYIGLIAVVQFIGCFFLPESPRWLIRQNQYQQAVKSLTRLVKRNEKQHALKSESTPEEKVKLMYLEFNEEQKNTRDNQMGKAEMVQRTQPHDDEMTNIESSLQSKENETKITWNQKLKQTYYLICLYKRQVLIAVGCAVGQNFTMGNSIVYFSVDILKQAGLQNSNIAGIGIGFMKFIGVLLAIFSVDYFGRRPILLWGSVATCSCLFTFSILFALKNIAQLNVSIVTAIIMLIHIFSWNFSWAGLMFVVASEVLPSSIRSTGMALTITVFWLCSFILQTFLEPAMSLITTQGAFAACGCLNILSILFVIYFVPEYTNIELENINKISKKESIELVQTTTS